MENYKHILEKYHIQVLGKPEYRYIKRDDYRIEKIKNSWKNGPNLNELRGLLKFIFSFFRVEEFAEVHELLLDEYLALKAFRLLFEDETLRKLEEIYKTEIVPTGIHHREVNQLIEKLESPNGWKMVNNPLTKTLLATAGLPSFKYLKFYILRAAVESFLRRVEINKALNKADARAAVQIALRFSIWLCLVFDDLTEEELQQFMEFSEGKSPFDEASEWFTKIRRFIYDDKYRKSIIDSGKKKYPQLSHLIVKFKADATKKSYYNEVKRFFRGFRKRAPESFAARKAKDLGEKTKKEREGFRPEITEPNLVQYWLGTQLMVYSRKKQSYDAFFEGEQLEAEKEIDVLLTKEIKPWFREAIEEKRVLANALVEPSKFYIPSENVWAVVSLLLEGRKRVNIQTGEERSIYKASHLDLALASLLLTSYIFGIPVSILLKLDRKGRVKFKKNPYKDREGYVRFNGFYKGISIDKAEEITGLRIQYFLRRGREGELFIKFPDYLSKIWTEYLNKKLYLSEKFSVEGKSFFEYYEREKAGDRRSIVKELTVEKVFNEVKKVARLADLYVPLNQNSILYTFATDMLSAGLSEEEIVYLTGKYFRQSISSNFYVPVRWKKVAEKLRERAEEFRRVLPDKARFYWLRGSLGEECREALVRDIIKETPQNASVTFKGPQEERVKPKDIKEFFSLLEDILSRPYQRNRKLSQKDEFLYYNTLSLYIYYALSLVTGARPSELETLKREWSCIEEGFIAIEEGKSNRFFSESRIIPIPENLVPLIKRYIGLREKYSFWGDAKEFLLFGIKRDRDRVVAETISRTNSRFLSALQDELPWWIKEMPNFFRHYFLGKLAEEFPSQTQLRAFVSGHMVSGFEPYGYFSVFNLREAVEKIRMFQKKLLGHMVKLKLIEIDKGLLRKIWEERRRALSRR